MVIVTRRVDDRRSALIERCHNSCHSELFMGQRRNRAHFKRAIADKFR